MEMFLHIAIKLAVGFMALFISAKVIGGREIKQLSPYDFISAIVLSELVGNGLYVDEVNIAHILFTITLWTSFIVLMNKISIKKRNTRKLLDGMPSYFIHDGRVDKEQLRKNNMDLDEMLSLLRQKDIFSVNQVKFAIIESNGNISVFKNDMNANQLAFPVIMDGEIQLDALHRKSKEQLWLVNELKKQGYKGIEDIFYAEITQGGELVVAGDQPPSKSST
ncbi:DUF421 domain-containing protein [Paenibacillus marinisediminis]